MSSIIKAIHRAYGVMRERNWDTIHWAIDLHGVCLKSNYQTHTYQWINPEALQALRLIGQQPENKIILWSSCHDEEKKVIIDFFHQHGIPVFDFNRNVQVRDTNYADFSEKFYFSLLLDDKAGFDPDTDWRAIIELYS